MKQNADIEIAVRVLRTTEKAVQVDFGGKELVWVPRSQINDWGPGTGELEGAESIFIPEWLAMEKGMI